MKAPQKKLVKRHDIGFYEESIKYALNLKERSKDVPFSAAAAFKKRCQNIFVSSKIQAFPRIPAQCSSDVNSLLGLSAKGHYFIHECKAIFGLHN